jgi:hypothetical protein
VLSPFDDFPIHANGNPVAHVLTGDPNHYDRYFFNGHSSDATLYFAAAMGHYPVRGVIDGAFSILVDGVQHSIFASGVMPLDRRTDVGPLHIEVIDPMRTIRFVVTENEHGISAYLTWRAGTVAVEEPRSTSSTPFGVPATDFTRLTQWGTWEGAIIVDEHVYSINPTDVTGTRDRSWGIKPQGKQLETNWPRQHGQALWLWAPLHFPSTAVHVMFLELPDGSRRQEAAMFVDPLSPDTVPWSADGIRHGSGLRYALQKNACASDVLSADFLLVDDAGRERRIELETVQTYRMRGVGYRHPYWLHGSNHGELETARESVPLAELDGNDPMTRHAQSVVIATLDGERGIGVLEHLLPY